MTAEGSVDPREIAKEASRLARDAARLAREEALNEARRLRDEARRMRRDDQRRRGSRRGGDDDAATDGATVQGALDVEGVRHVLVKQTAGRLTIRPCRDGEAPGVETSASKSPPELSVNRDGDRLAVDIRLSVGRLFRRRRGADTLIRLGPGFASLQVDMAHGHLVIGNIGCDDLSVDVGAGNVSLRGVRANAAIDVGAGQVVAEAHSGLVTCDCGTGDVRIEVAEARPGSYSLEVGIGQAEIALPPGLKVHSSVSSGLGKSEVTYPDAGEQAEIQVRVSTGLGRAAVRPGDAIMRPAGDDAPAARRSAASRRTESEEVRVLQLLEQGRITAQEAADLIAALQGAPRPSEDSSFD